jgi:hypothetical protein
LPLSLSLPSPSLLQSCRCRVTVSTTIPPAASSSWLLPVGQECRHHGCRHPHHHSPLLPPPPLLPSLLPAAISADAIAAIVDMDNFLQDGHGTDSMVSAGIDAKFPPERGKYIGRLRNTGFKKHSLN